MENVTETESRMEGLDGLLGALRPDHHPLNWLALALPVAVFADATHSTTLAFIASMIAIMPLALLLGHGTEELALRTGETVGGLLNATLGNAVEIIIAIIAIFTAANYLAEGDGEGAADMIQLVQASLVGSMLGNMLLVMGLAFLWGGLRHKSQRFSLATASSNSGLLMLAVIGISIPAFVNIAHRLETGTSIAMHDLMQISIGVAVAMLFAYVLSLLFILKTHSHLFQGEETGHSHETPHMSVKAAVVLLLASTILVAWMAEILVHSIAAAGKNLHLPALFIGVILVPLFGNAAEHFTAVTVAGKNKMDLSVVIALGSTVQIALFVAPLTVLLGAVMGVDMTLDFGVFPTMACLAGVLVATIIIADGTSNWLEGALLLTTYAMIAMAFFII